MLSCTGVYLTITRSQTHAKAAGRSPDFDGFSIFMAFPRVSWRKHFAVTIKAYRNNSHKAMRACLKSIPFVTVAGTVYESHVLPYSPAFKPAPAAQKRTSTTA
jgi:hypothetical protein